MCLSILAPEGLGFRGFGFRGFRFRVSGFQVWVQHFVSSCMCLGCSGVGGRLRAAQVGYLAYLERLGFRI